MYWTYRSLVLTLLSIEGINTVQLQRNDTLIDGPGGRRLFVREIRAENASTGRPPLILVHGARVPGVPSFDLPVSGGSLAADLAGRGLDVYVMDVRGYGYSDRLPEMEAGETDGPPLVRAAAASADIGAVVDWVRERAEADTVALLGWATGGMWCGHYATVRPETVSHLVLYNSLYQSPGHPSLGSGSDLEDPEHPGQFNARDTGPFRYSQGPSLLGAWDASIPSEDKGEWRDPAVAEAYVREALASDATSAERQPPSFRAPSGALEDSFYQATGRQIWDASLIRARTLIIASANDFWSQPLDRERLAAHLVHASEVRTCVVAGGTHFVHLERPERGRDQLLDEVAGLLSSAPPTSAALTGSSAR